MEIEDDEKEEETAYRTALLRVIACIALFPVLWLGVVINFLGLAERFAFLPGISKQGGVMSGLAALAITIVILGIIVGGASAAASSNLSIIDDRDQSVGKSTPTPTPEPTDTPDPTQTEAPESTKTANSLSDLDRFEAQYRSHLRYTLKNESLIPVPVLATEYRQLDNGAVELWVVYWECDNYSDTNSQRVTVANYIAKTAGGFQGTEPMRVRIYSVNSLEIQNSSITKVSISEAKAVNIRNISLKEYTNTWWNRLRVPKRSERDIAFEMTMEDSGRSVAEEAFIKQYPFEESDKGCPTIEG